MMISIRVLVAVLALLGMAAEPSLAQGRGGGGGGPPAGGGAYRGGGGAPGGGHPPGGGYYHGGGHYYGGHYYGGAYPYYPWWGGVGLGIGIGLASGYYWNWPYYGYAYAPPYYSDYAAVPANPGYTVATAPPPAAASMPEPIYYPRNGQSDQQKEIDLRDCNRWATTQPPAMADASVFQRAVLACMDGRGYTGR